MRCSRQMDAGAHLDIVIGRHSPSPLPSPPERERRHGSECRNVSFRVCSAVERGEDDELFRRLYRAPSPGGEGWG